MITDGLVERRGHELPDLMARLLALVEDNRHQPLLALVNTVAEQAPAGGDDDVVVLGARVG